MTKHFTTGTEIESAMIKAGLTVDGLHSLCKLMPKRIQQILDWPFVPESAREDYEAIRECLELPQLPAPTNEHQLAIFDKTGNGVLYSQTETGKPFHKISAIHTRTFFENMRNDARQPTAPFRDITITTISGSEKTNDPHLVNGASMYVPHLLDHAAHFRGGCWTSIIRNEPRPLGGFENVIAEIESALSQLKHQPDGSNVTAHILQSTSSTEIFPRKPIELTDEEKAERAEHQASRSARYRAINERKVRERKKARKNAA